MEAAKYGFRTSSSRTVLVDQVQAAYTALDKRGADADTSLHSLSSNGDSSMFDSTETDTDDDGSMGDLTVQLLAESRQSQTSQTHAPYGIEAPATPLETRERRTPHDSLTSRANNGHTSCANDGHSGGSCTTSDRESDTGTESESDDSHRPEPSMGRVPALVAKKIHDAILANEDLYDRILLFEPISFDEALSTVKQAGVTIRSKEVLRNWLDVQCICFYTAELSGPRYRY